MYFWSPCLKTIFFDIWCQKNNLKMRWSEIHHLKEFFGQVVILNGKCDFSIFREKDKQPCREGRQICIFYRMYKPWLFQIDISSHTLRNQQEFWCQFKKKYVIHYKPYLLSLYLNSIKRMWKKAVQSFWQAHFLRYTNWPLFLTMLPIFVYFFSFSRKCRFPRLIEQWSK